VSRHFSHEKAQKAQKQGHVKAAIKDTDAIFRLCDVVRETGFAIHRYHRNGHVEKVYQNALLHRLRKQGLAVEAEVPLTVFDEDGTVLGDFRADLLVAQSLLLELKAVKRLEDEHVAQVLGYLRASRLEHALLINFGGGKYEIRKFILQDALKGF